MQQLKNTLEQKFKHLAYFAFDHSKKIVPIIIISVLALVANLYFIEFDVSTESFLSPKDEKRIAYDEYRDQFGKDSKIIIAIETEDIYNPSFLNQLHQIEQDLFAEVPYIDDIQSLVSARKTTGENDTLLVGDLFARFPITSEDVQGARDYIKNSTFFTNLIINEKGTITNIVITPLTYSSLGEETTQEVDEFSDFTDIGMSDENTQKRAYLTETENTQMIDAIRIVLAKYENISHRLVGMPLLTNTLIGEMIWTIVTFVCLLLFIIIVLLARFFKRKEGVILPIMTVGLSVASTVGIMSALRVPFMMLSGILPSFILSIGIGSSLHIVSLFFKQYDITKDKRESIAYAFGHSGLAIVLTSLTTIASLLSFAFSDIPPMGQLGIFASVGAFMALFMTLVLLPAMVAKLPIKPKEQQVVSHQRLDDFLQKIALFSIRNAKAIVLVGAVLVSLTLYLASLLEYKHDPIAWLPKDNEFRQNTNYIDKELKGSMNLEIVLDTNRENGLYQPEVLQAMELSIEQIYAIETDTYYVGKAISIVEILKEINQALHNNDHKYFTIPDEKNLIAQEFLLFENSGSSDLETLVDNRFSKTHISLKVPWIDTKDYKPFLQKIETIVNQNLQTHGQITITGMIPMLVQTVNSTIESTINSYVVAYGLITLMMIVLLGNVKLGLISMVPNVSPVLLGLSAMYLFQMNLDLFTILIGAIAIGLAVDDTIHFMHNFQRYHHETGDVDEAIVQTFLTTGRAMLITSLVLSLGFFVYLFSDMGNIFNFGAITGLVILTALVADFILTPAILKLSVADSKTKE